MLGFQNDESFDSLVSKLRLLLRARHSLSDEEQAEYLIKDLVTTYWVIQSEVSS